MPDCQQIIEAVNTYNTGLTLESELGLRSFLASQEEVSLSHGRLLGEVCVIAEWGGIPRQIFPFGERVRAAMQIELRWGALEPLRELTTEDWLADEAIIQTVVTALGVIIPLGPPITEHNQLSFVSKFLHWRVNRTFPLWDGRTREAVRMQNVVVNDDADWDSYAQWWKQIRDEILHHQDCCLKALRLPGENVVRTLDKALWVLGGRVNQA
jgi:hypothetical protein